MGYDSRSLQKSAITCTGATNCSCFEGGGVFNGVGLVLVTTKSWSWRILDSNASICSAEFELSSFELLPLDGCFGKDLFRLNKRFGGCPLARFDTFNEDASVASRALK